MFYLSLSYVIIVSKYSLLFIAMNQTQIQLCLKIFKKLRAMPISNLFLGTPEFPCEAPMEHPSSFRSIETKLQRGLYQNPQQWNVEMQQLFEAFMKNSEKDPLRAAAAEQLLYEFQQNFNQENPNSKGLSLKLGLLCSEFEDYVLRSKQYHPKEIREGEPGAKIFDTDPENISIKQLAREIKFLHSPNLLLDVASFVFKSQPECLHMDTELTLEFELMNEQTLIGTKKLVRSLLHDAAIGKVDPYKNSLENMDPIILRRENIE